MLEGINAKLSATAAAILLGFCAGGPAQVQITRVTLPHHRGPVRIHEHRKDGSYTSSNWSGFALTPGNGTVTSVSGSWVVPTATCGAAENDKSGYAAFWVGIDGFSSSTVEQIGTDSDCVSTNGRQTNTPTYYAWFEFYPAGSYLISWKNGSVQPGDVITASVSYAGQSTNGRRGSGGPEFTVTLTDFGSPANGAKNLTYSTSSVVNSAKQSSAEWIAEAPCCGRGNTVLPLADFTTVNFSSAEMNGSGVPLSLSATGNLQLIDMVGESTTSLIKAGPVSASGNGFSETWYNAGP